MDFQFRPLGPWTGNATPPDARRRSPFKASYDDTLILLFAEAERLDAGHLVLQVDIAARDIRIDGLPRANARYGDHPGVVVSFDSMHGPLRYATDMYSAWRGNLRAIALSLQALRAVDRYGVSRSGEQYRGWNALPAASGAPFTTPAEAEQWMRKMAVGAGINPDVPRAALHKSLRRVLHPDASNGNRVLWDHLGMAAELLDAREPGGA